MIAIYLVFALFTSLVMLACCLLVLPAILLLPAETLRRALFYPEKAKRS